ncbi:hypothetical protein B0H12DRAFT_233323 [Mycena haematopus]|nr:hypothetical protein B0H12DRAFT_233323 [Mycena haematopus]
MSRKSIITCYSATPVLAGRSRWVHDVPGRGTATSARKPPKPFATPPELGSALPPIPLPGTLPHYRERGDSGQPSRGARYRQSRPPHATQPSRTRCAPTTPIHSNTTYYTILPGPSSPSPSFPLAFSPRPSLQVRSPKTFPCGIRRKNGTCMGSSRRCWP